MWRAWPAVPAEPRHRPPLPLLSTHASHACRALQVPSGWSAVAYGGCYSGGGIQLKAPFTLQEVGLRPQVLGEGPIMGIQRKKPGQKSFPWR